MEELEPPQSPQVGAKTGCTPPKRTGRLRSFAQHLVEVVAECSKPLRRRMILGIQEQTLEKLVSPRSAEGTTWTAAAEALGCAEVTVYGTSPWP